MKRSEMLKTLHNAITDMSNLSLSDKELSYILTQLERKGMLAPQIKNSLTKPKDYRYGMLCTMRCDCEDCNPDYLVSKWESENE